MSEIKKKKISRKPMTVLPISIETIRDPAEFANWIYSHTPLILQELFNALPDAPPAEQLKTLSSLYQTGLSYRPLVAFKSDSSKDTATKLMEMLKAPDQENSEDQEDEAA